MSSANININRGSNSEIYCHDLEYLPENTFNVNKLEDAEQLRRIADKDGENNKRVLALQLSETFGDSLRATWFQRGSSFVLSLLGGVRSAVASKATTLTASVAHTAGDLGHKAAADLQHKAGDVNLKAHEVAHNLSSSTQAAALNLKNKGVEGAHNLAHGLQEKGWETAHNVSSFAQGKVFEASSFLSGKVQEYAQKLKDVIKMNNSFTGHSNLTFALLEEEAERARRMNSSEEEFAIKNALKLSKMIKGLNGASTSGPFSHYSSSLIEEAERARRVAEVKGEDKAAIDNAKTVSALINQKFNLPAQAQFPIAKEAKVELAEESAIKKSFVPAM